MLLLKQAPLLPQFWGEIDLLPPGIGGLGGLLEQ